MLTDEVRQRLVRGGAVAFGLTRFQVVAEQVRRQRQDALGNALGAGALDDERRLEELRRERAPGPTADLGYRLVTAAGHPDGSPRAGVGATVDDRAGGLGPARRGRGRAGHASAPLARPSAPRGPAGPGPRAARAG